jgi:hypothetical protein
VVVPGVVVTGGIVVIVVKVVGYGGVEGIVIGSVVVGNVVIGTVGYTGVVGIGGTGSVTIGVTIIDSSQNSCRYSLASSPGLLYWKCAFSIDKLQFS